MPAGEPSTSPAVDRPRWRIALDTGGTFTDLVGVAPDGTVVRVKVPSDGTLAAAAAAPVDGAVLQVRWAGGMRVPDGTLAGWRADLRGESVEVAWNEGDTVRAATAWPIALASGEPLRFVPPNGLVDAPRLGMHLLTGTPL